VWLIKQFVVDVIRADTKYAMTQLKNFVSNYRFTPEEKAKRPPMCYLPFGTGSRSCIGMRLALLESKIALIKLMRKVSFVRSTKTEVNNVLFNITLNCVKCNVQSITFVQILKKTSCLALPLIIILNVCVFSDF